MSNLPAGSDSHPPDDHHVEHEHSTFDHNDLTLTLPRDLVDEIHGWHQQHVDHDHDSNRFAAQLLERIEAMFPSYIGCQCTNGYLWDQTYGEAEDLPGYVPVQRCDLCETFDSDYEAAGRAAAERHTQPVIAWELDENGQPLVGWQDGHHEWCVVDIPQGAAPTWPMADL